MNYRFILVCILFFFAGSRISAQINSAGAFDARPVLLFSQFPTTTNCKVSELEKAFSATDDDVVLYFIENHPWRAKIISRAKQNEAAEIINLSLMEFRKTFLSISRLKREDGTFQYHGLMWSEISDDAFVISRVNKQYLFSKTEKRLVIAE